MRRAYRARWARLLAVWVGLVGLLWAVTQLWGCAPAYCAEWDDLGIVHKTLIAEAGGEGIEGMQAVANVIRNRAVRRGMTVEAVCLQRLQFSAWNDGSGPVDRMVKRNEGVWDDALMAWQLSGTDDITGGADHYHTKAVNPRWNRGMTRTATIGRHIFYRS